MKIDASKLRDLVKSLGLTNTKLADQAGITRQSLQAMLRADQVVEVRETTLKGLTQALRLSDESLLSPDPLVGYKQAIAEEHNDLTYCGMGLPNTEPRLLDEVYVAIRVFRVPEREDDHDCQPLMFDSDDGLNEGSEELTVDHCLALHRRILIRGEPGCGKTTALRHTARAVARGIIGQGFSGKESRVPMMLRLAEFAKACECDSEMTLIRFVVTRTLRDASPDYLTQVEHHLENELKGGNCLVLLDGLDEVGTDGRLSILLRAFVEGFGQNQFVLTSRIVGLDPGPWQKSGFTTFEAARWSDDDIQEFSQRWYADRPEAGKRRKSSADPRAAALTTAILNHRSLRAIASNPLMLTILAALHHANATLPRTSG